MRLDRDKLNRFTKHWDTLYEAFPAARAAAVAAMGKAVQQELETSVVAEGVDDMFGHIRNTQRPFFGSLGGWAAVRPIATPMTDRYGKVKRFKGKQVTTRQVTRWLERGHPVRKPSGLDARYRPRMKSSSLVSKGKGGTWAGVKGYLFYSTTRRKAVDHALKAADRALSIISDEIDY